MSPQVAELKELDVATQGFQGGINIRDAIDQLQPNELLKCENVVFDNAGGLAKRLGGRNMGTFGSGGDRILSEYTYYRPGTTPQVLIHTTAGIMYYTNDVTANPTTWTSLKTGLSTTVPASFETQNSKAYFAEGTLMGQWDGTTYTTIAGAPSGVSLLRTWKDTMWAAAPANNPDRVYSSSAGDPTTWPGANFVDMLHGDGDQLSALASDGLFLIASKRRRIQVIYDPALLSNRTADFEKGSESHFSWVHMENKLYFLSRLGICWWQGDSSATLISFKIDPLFNPNVLNLNMLSKAYAYQIGTRCGWAVPENGSSVNTLILEYYPRLGPIYQISGSQGPGPWAFHRFPFGCSAFTTVRQGTTEALYAGSTTANKHMWVYSPDGTDDGTTINSLVQVAPQNLGSPFFTKYLRRAKVVGRGKFNFQLMRNYQSAVYVTKSVNMQGSSENWNDHNWGAKPWGLDAAVKTAIIDLDAYVVAVSIRITDSETTTGTSPLPVGSIDYSLTLGEWALYEVSFMGELLGLR